MENQTPVGRSGGDMSSRATVRLANNLPLEILLVEDSDINRQLLIRQIRRFGYEPLSAHSGEEALDIAGKRHFDLILLDVNLGGISGIEACQRLREMEETDTFHAPAYIVAITASSDPKQQVECLSAGMNDCLGKPISSRALGELFQNVARQQKSGATRRDAGSASPAASSGQVLETLDEHRFANLLDLTDSEKFVLQQLLEMFQNSLQENVVRLRSALSLEDSVVAAKAAHAIKSSSLEIGAARIAQSAGIAEDLARQGELTELWSFINNLPLLQERFAESFQRTVDKHF